VLIHTYAIAEAAAAQRLTRNQRTIGAIEDWGTELLAAAGSSWDDVEDGLAGTVEVAVVRNACAHRSRFIDRASAKRLTNARVTALGEGDPVTLSYPTLRNYRRRLRLLLGAGGIGHGG
jgi:phage-related minor tail protein